MPFHGLAGSVVLAGLKAGQRAGPFVAELPGSLPPKTLLAAGFRRFSCKAEEKERSFWRGRPAAALSLWRRGSSVPAPPSLVEEFDAAPTSSVRHPLWKFEVDALKGLEVLFCCCVLFLAGILCAAGGIGGGGIYVTVLMVAGGLSVVDAVPLSKAVVFLGSVPSLVLNMRKAVGGRGLIDYGICRLVVPSSLLGTYLGVVLNRLLPSWSVLLALCAVLFFMTIMVARTTLQQLREEQEGKDAKARPMSGQLPGEESPGQLYRAALPHETRPEEPEDKRQLGSLSLAEAAASLALLTAVVAFGVFRHHASLCRENPLGEACHHPVLAWLGRGTLHRWMTSGVASGLLAVSVLIPCIACLAVATLCSSALVLKEGWSLSHVLSYNVMGVATGCLAGLVGIGGGLIFSPFFLLMAVEPSVAVATSSTCVIFTSSSTTMQYLLTDRVVVSLAVVYGLVNVLASYAGTSLVHRVGESCASRKWLVSAIVGMGVLISAVLAFVKLGNTAAGVAEPLH